jgi:tetratricopeptide (TPR) repeat protein
LEYEAAERIIEWLLSRSRELGANFDWIYTIFNAGMLQGNQGRISEALTSLQEGMRLAELNDESFWLPRLPNTIGWLHRELQNLETALRLNNENVTLAHDLGFPEGEANAHVNLGHDYLLLDEPEHALEHLQAAEQIYKSDVWLRWRYNIRLQAEFANYWIKCGDLNLATSHATASLQASEKTLSRKYIAWANKLLGDIAILEDRVEDGKKHFETALLTLTKHPCPTIEWKILKASADLAKKLKDDPAATEFRGRAKAVIQLLADSVKDDKLCKIFLSSKAVREL